MYMDLLSNINILQIIDEILEYITNIDILIIEKLYDFNQEKILEL
jgi:hypothetical protein